jgi:hypothetical protein
MKYIREKKVIWSIGIYTGKTPFDLSSPANLRNPVLSASDVTDVPAKFVADPFMIKHNELWYMFFEVGNRRTKKGEIGLSISSDGLKWTYKHIVLSEPFHLSYPYVFEFENSYYMIPEASRTNSIRLYKANSFPYEWRCVNTLLERQAFTDPSIVHFNGKWWLFTYTNINRNLNLYYADELYGPWIDHPKSPIVKEDATKARPGGRIIIVDNNIIRFAQDCHSTYGNQVRAFKITVLTTNLFCETEITKGPILKGGSFNWNQTGMHTIDAHHVDNGKWIACVDGRKDVFLSDLLNYYRFRLMEMFKSFLRFS